MGLLFLLPMVMGSCGGNKIENRHDEVTKLRELSTWNAEQTQQAIDIYLEGLDDQSKILETAMSVGEKYYFFNEDKCDREVLNQNLEKINKQRQLLDTLEKKLLQNLAD